MPQFLKWLVQGSVRWYAEGLKSNIPECVRAKTQASVLHNDAIQQFINERCDVTDPRSFTPTTDLLGAFSQWGGDFRLTNNSFVAA